MVISGHFFWFSPRLSRDLHHLAETGTSLINEFLGSVDLNQSVEYVSVDIDFNMSVSHPDLSVGDGSK
jgi:hypothetical protein